MSRESECHLPGVSRCRSVRSLGWRPRCVEGRRQDVCVHRCRCAGRLSQDRQHRDSGNADRGRSWREGALSPSLMGEPALGHIGRRASAQAHSILRAGPFQSHEEVASPAPSIRLKGRGAPPRKAESWQLDRRNARVGRRPALRPHAFFPGLAALPEAAGSNGPASDHVAQGGIVCRPHPRKASDLASFRCHVTQPRCEMPVHL